MYRTKYLRILLAVIREHVSWAFRLDKKFNSFYWRFRVYVWFRFILWFTLIFYQEPRIDEGQYERPEKKYRLKNVCY